MLGPSWMGQPDAGPVKCPLVPVQPQAPSATAERATLLERLLRTVLMRRIFALGLVRRVLSPAHGDRSVHKFIRYSMVSGVAIVISQATILICAVLFHLSGIAANTAGAITATPASYELNRKWAWGKRGKSHMWKEVAPFWGLTIVGYLGSTGTVEVADNLCAAHHVTGLGRGFAIMGASLCAYGVVWVAKFIVFNKLVFAGGADVRATPGAMPTPAPANLIEGTAPGAAPVTAPGPPAPKSPLPPQRVPPASTAGVAAPARLEVAAGAKGFMPHSEGMGLYRAGLAAGRSELGPLVEIGTYCGKSAVYLGAAARETGCTLFSVDHHRGSEELQPGWPHHDPEVVDPASGRVETLPWARRTLAAAGLEAEVVLVVGSSSAVAKFWAAELGLLFIDGGHGADAAAADFSNWGPKVARGGLLAVHDVFADPAEGGQVPHELYCGLLASGRFAEVEALGSLRVACAVRFDPRRRRGPGWGPHVWPAFP